MLSQEQINEIRDHLEKAQNPVFFFDNDSDGLCSFLLLSRWIGRGKGVAVKSFPDLNENYFRKVDELNADYIFILDKPIVSNGFFNEVEQRNLPVVWIDHHEFQEGLPDFVNYYNPINVSNKPTSYLCYQITEKKDDLWIAVIGCISDKFIPDFYNSFKIKFPDMAIDSTDAFDIFYKSQIGKIAKIFNFALKDRTTNVVNMMRYLISAKSPYDILEENAKNYSMHSRFKQINIKYKNLLRKAESEKSEGKILFFKYGGDLSISSDLSNELSYKFPNKLIVVVYVSGIKANISMRGKNSREIILKAIDGLQDATGGGHEDAVGAKIRVEDLDEFRERLEDVSFEKEA